MTQPGKLISLRSVLVWGLLNLAILGLGAVGFPIWAHHLLPRESLSFHELICGQILLASLLFPMLSETPWTLGINLALLLPIDESGGLLSNLDQTAMFRCYACVGIWIAGLGLWRLRSRSERSHLILIAIASCITAGGAVLDYLRWEAASATDHAEQFVPVSLLPKLCDLTYHFEPNAWIQASFPIISAVLWIGLVRIANRHSTSLHNSA